MRIRFDKNDAFITIHDRIRFLVLFDYSYCDEICDNIKYLISEKKVPLQIVLIIIWQFWIDSYDSLPNEKLLTFSNVIILIKSVASKIKNNYYQNIFLEKVHIKINPIQNIFKWMFVYYKCYISIELTFLKELMLIKQVHLKCVIFVTTGIF